jgi:hypothetical protein
LDGKIKGEGKRYGRRRDNTTEKELILLVRGYSRDKEYRSGGYA